MKKGTPRVLGMIAAGLGLILLLVMVGVWRDQQAVRLFKDALIAGGENLKVNELIPPYFAEAHQAAIELTGAASRFPNNSPIVSLNPPRKMRIIAPGKATVGWQVPDLREEAGQTNRWEDLDAELAAAEPVLRELRKLLKSPSFNWNLAYGQGFSLLMPHLAKIKQIVQWLATATMNDLHASRLDLALANHTAMLQAVNSLQDEPLIISQLVRAACAAIAFTATWEALQTNGWTDAQLGEMQAAWETIRFARSLERSLEMERAMGVEALARSRSSHAELHRQLAGLALPDTAARRVGTKRPRWVNEFAAIWSDSVRRLRTAGRDHLWQWVWSYGDEYHYLRTVEARLKALRAAEANWMPIGIRLPIDDDFIAPARQDGVAPRHLFSTHLLSFLDRTLQRVKRIETQRELAVTAVALKRFRLRHERWPADLNALVPGFLGQLPMDPMDGQTLRYRLNSDGSFTLYSVNVDGKDDSGDPTPPKDKAKSHDFAYGRDMVWPVPADVKSLF